ncbi:kinase-like domain-containing protein [Naematelia encephala]|uniref:Kinase-like domain-containing protein n=1 Tax=Naematelia encephala TaxID=71784 RepID=A0A1Y2BGD2_9TREE|nr:kinase-like domain-containing protein [Naematelia encephala]
MPSSSLAAEQHSEIAARYLHGHTLDSIFLAEYQLRDELGSGGFGFVCSAVQTGVGNVAGIEVAVKFIFKNRINEHDYTEVNGEPVESYVLRECDHPGIIRFLALFEDDQFFYLVQEIHGRPWSQNAALGCEVAQATSVPTLLQQHFLNPFSASPINHAMTLPGPLFERPGMARRASYDLFEAVEHRTFDEDQARHIFRQLVSAVQYMHARGMYHRDLKDENIVMDEHLVVKIIDFGSAVIENRLLSPVLHSQFRGTTTYAAPEVLNGESYHAGPADVWALGIILSIVLTGTSPFESTDHARCGRMQFKVPVSLDAEHLLGRCLRVDAARRATINEIAQHRWFRNGFAAMRPY